MGPFPHQSAPARITTQNPAGTDGFEFVEFAHPNPDELARIFTRMGFTEVARHKVRDISLYRQGNVNYLINREPGSHADRFVDEHGPCASSMAWRVVNANQALDRALQCGATEYTGRGKAIDAPAVVGIGGSLLYFVDQYEDNNAIYDHEFDWIDGQGKNPVGAGFYYLDHLTHNVRRGNMDKWFEFYSKTFNFKEIRFFNIEGKVTGLFSRALTSPCGKIRIPINESADDQSQIEEYIRRYKGEGIQHIAIGTEDIYESTAQISDRGVEFMPGPPDSYYEMSRDRVCNHEEPIARLKEHGILIDGEGVVDGGSTRVLLQIFSKTVIGPIFFEFIQRKGDDGFGEGNFKALFESIEVDQIQRGVING